MTIFPPSRCFLFSCILHAWRVCPYLLQFPALPSRAVLQFILESVISLGVTNIYIYVCIIYIYVYIYISIYMNAYQRHALEDPVEECRATHPIAWCRPHPDGFGTCILGEKVSKIHWWKLVSTHQLSHFSMAIPGGSRGFTFSDTPTCAMRDSNPQEVTCSFSPPPKEKVIKTSTENHLKQHFSSRFPGSIYSLS